MRPPKNYNLFRNGSSQVNLISRALIGPDMSNLCLHTGGIAVDYNKLGNFTPPEPTKTYTPMSHVELASMVKEAATRLLPEMELISEDYGVSPKSGENSGNRMFGVLTYEVPGCSDMGLSLGMRNSYDQSLSVGVCSGSKVFVCDNLAFVGNVKVARKHTGELHAQMEKLISYSISQSPKHFQQVLEDRKELQNISLNDDQAWSILGVAYGRELIKPRQLLLAMRAWQEPPQDAFRPRNAWSLYNAFTEALKSSSALDVMESHIDIHDFFMEFTEEIPRLNGWLKVQGWTEQDADLLPHAEMD